MTSEKNCLDQWQVRLVLMELHLFDWCSIGEMLIIIKTKNVSDGFSLSSVAFYLSIGSNGTIGTNGIKLIRLVFYW